MQSYREECISALNSVDLDAVEEVVLALLEVRKAAATVYIAGNGGSAATASHIATDLMMGSTLTDPPLRVIALNDNTAIMTATGNDRDFAQIYSRQLALLARPGDVAFAVSASGNSPNILAFVDEAKTLGLRTIAFTGFDGGRLSTMVDVHVHVPTPIGAYGPVEDVHLAVNHMITEQLKSVARAERERP